MCKKREVEDVEDPAVANIAPSFLSATSRAFIENPRHQSDCYT